MENIYIKLHDGAGDPEKKWTNGINRFLTESGAIVEPGTVDQIGQQALSSLVPKMQSGQMQEPEFTMALLEAVLPLCPTAATRTSLALRATSSMVSTVLIAMRQLMADSQAGVPLERLRLSAINLDKVLKMAKAKIPAVAADLKKKNSEMQALRAQASALLNQLESTEIQAEKGKASEPGVVFHKFNNLKDLIDARNAIERSNEGGDEDGDEDGDVEENGKSEKKVLVNVEAVGASTIIKSYEAERNHRQGIALQLYLLKTKMSLVKSAAVSVARTGTIFNKIPFIFEVERNVADPGFFDHIKNFIYSKIKPISEKASEQAQEIKRIMSGISEFYSYSSHIEAVMKEKGMPMWKLIEALPQNDYFHKNYDALMDLEEIYQNSSGSQRRTQQAHPKSDIDASSISFEQFAKSFPGMNLDKTLGSQQKEDIKNTINEINASPGMTWTKGMAMSLLSDPPSKPATEMLGNETVESGGFGQNTLMGESVEVGATPAESPEAKKLELSTKRRKRAADRKDLRGRINDSPNSPKVKEWQEKILAAEKEIEELDGIIKQLSTGAKTYNRAGARLGRKLFEVNRENPHWIVLMDAIRPSFVNRQTATEAELGAEKARNAFESVAQKTESGGTNSNTKAQIKKQNNKIRSSFEDLNKIEGIKFLNSKELVVAAIENEKVPAWILMRAVQFPFDKETEELARFNLGERGWVEQVGEDGETAEDESGAYIWKRTAPTKPPKVTKKPTKAPKGTKKAPAKAPVAPKKAPAAPKAPAKKKAPEAPKGKGKKSSFISFREITAANLPTNPTQPVPPAPPAPLAASTGSQAAAEKEGNNKVVAKPPQLGAPGTPGVQVPEFGSVSTAKPNAAASIKNRLSKRG